MTVIGIDVALAQLVAKPGQQFTVTYIVGSGKDRGKRVIYTRCVLGAPAYDVNQKSQRVSLAHMPQQFEEKSYGRKYMDKGLLPITRLDLNEFRTLKISHITRINSVRVKH